MAQGATVQCFRILILITSNTMDPLMWSLVSIPLGGTGRKQAGREQGVGRGGSRGGGARGEGAGRERQVAKNYGTCLVVFTPGHPTKPKECGAVLIELYKKNVTFSCVGSDLHTPQNPERW